MWLAARISAKSGRTIAFFPCSRNSKQAEEHKVPAFISRLKQTNPGQWHKTFKEAWRHCPSHDPAFKIIWLNGGENFNDFSNITDRFACQSSRWTSEAACFFYQTANPIQEVCQHDT
jgi:hypothetical protein